MRTEHPRVGSSILRLATLDFDNLHNPQVQLVSTDAGWYWPD